MPESQSTTNKGAAGELPPEQLEKLADLVYRMLQRDLLRMRERAGRSPLEWR